MKPTLPAILATALTVAFTAVLAPGEPARATDTPPVRIVRWAHGDPTIRLMPAEAGFCYLSGIGGNFEGGGEAVRIWVDDGQWYVGGRSCQPSLWVEVTCVAWRADRQLVGAPRRPRVTP